MTKPFICPGGSLFVNADADTDRGGGIAVEVLGAEGDEISGYSASNVIRLVGDSIRHKVRWRSKENVDCLKGRMIVLRFSPNQASLYSFWFSDYDLKEEES